MNVVTKSIRVLREEGPRSLLQRVSRLAYKRFGAEALEHPLLAEDIVDSDSIRLEMPTARPVRGTPLKIGWVTVPPRAGSGGHTTLFRMVAAAEAAGHECRLYFYDRYGGDIVAQEEEFRSWWPQLRAEVRDAKEGIDDVDAVVASAWDTAHVVASRGRGGMRRLYFIQDYEPYFYPRGSMYALAEDSYRFGFRNISLGAMVGNAIREELGVETDVTEFGCDTSVYKVQEGAARSGVVLYARPDVPRRGYWLAELALQQFHRRHPDIPIHTYGTVMNELPFPAVQHGRLSPVELNALYNSCNAGIAMSFTNISLVAEEMLASGTIPVVNDSRHSRADLDNPFVEWVSATPTAIADGLSAAVARSTPDHARDAAASVRQIGWTRAESDVLRIIEEEVYGS